MQNPDSGRVLCEGETDRTLDALSPHEPIEHAARALRDRQRHHPIGDPLRAMALGPLAVRPGVAGGHRPAGARAGTPRAGVLPPSSFVARSPASFEVTPRRLQVFAKRREAKATHPFGKETFAVAMRLGPSGPDRLAGVTVQSAAAQPFRLPRCGELVSRRGWRRALAPVGERDADRDWHLWRRSVCLAADKSCGMNRLAIEWLGTGAASATPALMDW